MLLFLSTLSVFVFYPFQNSLNCKNKNRSVLSFVICPQVDQSRFPRTFFRIQNHSPLGFIFVLFFYFYFAPFIVLRNLLTGQSGAGITLSENGTATAKSGKSKKKNPYQIDCTLRAWKLFYLFSIFYIENDSRFKYVFKFESAELKVIIL